MSNCEVLRNNSAMGFSNINGNVHAWFRTTTTGPNDYNGSKRYTYEDDDGTAGTSTCDAMMTSLRTSSESPLADEDFSRAWSCDGKSSAVTDLVQGITNLGCCGVNGKSACWSEPTQANLCDGARIFFDCDAIGSKSECIAVSSCQMGC